MGKERGIAAFVAQCDDYYLSKNLFKGETSTTDGQGVEKMLRASIIQQRRDGAYTKDAAWSAWFDLGAVDWTAVSPEGLTGEQQDSMHDVLGEDWWEETIPNALFAS